MPDRINVTSQSFNLVGTTSMGQSRRDFTAGDGISPRTGRMSVSPEIKGPGVGCHRLNRKSVHKQAVKEAEIKFRHMQLRRNISIFEQSSLNQ